MDYIGISQFTDDVIKGTVTFTTVPSGVCVSINLKSDILRNSRHGIHVHEKPITEELLELENCCDSLGGHFNPTDVNHGHRSDKVNIYGGHIGGHVGDLCNNIDFDNQGRCIYSYVDELISINDRNKNCIIGRSLIIHDGVDDCGMYHKYKPGSKKAKDSKITGNAGSRISCANIIRDYFAD